MTRRAVVLILVGALWLIVFVLVAMVVVGAAGVLRGGVLVLHCNVQLQ